MPNPPSLAVSRASTDLTVTSPCSLCWFPQGHAFCSVHMQAQLQAYVTQQLSGDYYEFPNP